MLNYAVNCSGINHVGLLVLLFVFATTGPRCSFSSPGSPPSRSSVHGEFAAGELACINDTGNPARRAGVRTHFNVMLCRILVSTLPVTVYSVVDITNCAHHLHAWSGAFFLFSSHSWHVSASACHFVFFLTLCCFLFVWFLCLFSLRQRVCPITLLCSTTPPCLVPLRIVTALHSRYEHDNWWLCIWRYASLGAVCCN